MTKIISTYHLWAVTFVFLLFLCENEIWVTCARIPKQTTASRETEGKTIPNNNAIIYPKKN